MNDEIDELIQCEYGGCTLEAPCANHLAYRTLPEPVHTAITALVARREEAIRVDELNIASLRNEISTKYRLDRIDEIRADIAALTTEATQSGKEATDE